MTSCENEPSLRRVEKISVTLYTPILLLVQLKNFSGETQACVSFLEGQFSVRGDGRDDGKHVKKWYPTPGNVSSVSIKTRIHLCLNITSP